jgi:hypothetical protein
MTTHRSKAVCFRFEPCSSDVDYSEASATRLLNQRLLLGASQTSLISGSLSRNCAHGHSAAQGFYCGFTLIH